MNNNLEVENEDPEPNEISPRTNYGEGYENQENKSIAELAKKVDPSHDYLHGFIREFEEEQSDDWTVTEWLQWLKLNNFQILKKQ